MKRLFTVILAAVIMMLAVSCNNKSENEIPEKDNVQNEQSAENSGGADEKTPENDKTPIVLPEEPVDSKLKPISVEAFKEVIGYSMFPYDIPPVAEKNMIGAAGGFNGDVELFYYDFVTKNDAQTFFADIMAAFDVEPVLYQNDGDYELWKITDGDMSYMAARIGKSIVYGSSKKDLDTLHNWFYGLGYTEKQ